MLRVLFLKYILEHSCEFLQIVHSSFYKVKKKVSNFIYKTFFFVK
jgi:hypothetical protein